MILLWLIECYIDSFCSMHLSIDRFSQLLRCEQLQLRVWRYVVSRMWGCVYTSSFVLDCPWNRNPISNFSGTGRFTNSIAWERWLLWNNWLLQWSKKTTILKGHSQLLDMRIRYHFLVDLHITRHALWSWTDWQASYFFFTFSSPLHFKLPIIYDTLWSVRNRIFSVQCW